MQVGYASNGYSFVNTSTNATFVSSSQLTVPITTTTTADTWRVRVLNPDGQTSPGYVTFTVNAPANQPGSFTLSNNAPYWNSNAPAGPAVRLNWTPSTGAANYDVYRNGSLYAANLVGTTYLNNLNLTGGQTYSYYVVAKSGTQTRLSNTIQVLMPTAPPIPAPTLTGVIVNGPSSVVPGSSTPYTATAQFSSGPTLDVTASAQWSATGGPSGTRMTGSTLVAGSGAASAATVTATYGDNTGTKTGNKNVSIGTGLFVTATHAPPQPLGGNSYRVNLSATATGGIGAITFRWDINNDGIYGDLTGAESQWTLSSAGGTYRVGVEATDSQTRTARAWRNVTIDKVATPNQPVKLKPASEGFAGKFLDGNGNPFEFESARTANGLIVITHDGEGDGEETWIQQLVAAIEDRIPTANRPNILIYDWSEDASPLWTLGDVVDYGVTASDLALEFGPVKGFLDRVILKGTAPLSEALKESGFRRLAIGLRKFDANVTGKVLSFAGTLNDSTEGVNFAFEPAFAEAHAQILKGRLETEAGAPTPRVNFDAPIHFIGDGAGGWLLAETALLLKEGGRRINRVTALDTYCLMKYHFQELSAEPRSTVLERVVSSAWGDLTWPLYYVPQTSALFPKEDLRNSVQYLTSAVPWSYFYHHPRARNWYRDSAVPTSGLEARGFYHSPFVTPPAAAAFAAQVSSAANTHSLQITAALVAEFETFGNVQGTAGTYVITEDADAGIFKLLTLPPGATKLRFKFRFSGTSDGDFLGVRFGERGEFYLGMDTPISRDGFHQASVSIDRYAGQSDKLIFTLVSRGSTGTVLELKDIEIVESEDPDEDGLTNAAELAAGSNPQLPDTDWDGWSDAYEVNVSGTSPVFSDTDGDGTSDFAEAMAGTNPIDNASAFVTKQVTRSSDGSITVGWSGKTGKTYRVLRSTTPDFASFDVIATRIVGAEPLTSHTDSGTNLQGVPAAFYRVEVE